MYLYQPFIQLHDKADKSSTVGNHNPGPVHPSPSSLLEHLSDASVVLPGQADLVEGIAIFGHCLGMVD